MDGILRRMVHSRVQRVGEPGDFQEETVDSKLVLLIIVGVLSLPGGLFAAFLMSEPRARFASFIGGIIGAAVVGAGIYYFVNKGHVGVDMLSYGLGSFFGCSMGVFAGALIANWAVGLGSRGPVASGEY